MSIPTELHIGEPAEVAASLERCGFKLEGIPAVCGGKWTKERDWNMFLRKRALLLERHNTCKLQERLHQQNSSSKHTLQGIYDSCQLLLMGGGSDSNSSIEWPDEGPPSPSSVDLIPSVPQSASKASMNDCWNDGLFDTKPERTSQQSRAAEKPVASTSPPGFEEQSRLSLTDASFDLEPVALSSITNSPPEEHLLATVVHEHAVTGALGTAPWTWTPEIPAVEPMAVFPSIQENFRSGDAEGRAESLEPLPISASEDFQPAPAHDERSLLAPFCCEAVEEKPALPPVEKSALPPVEDQPYPTLDGDNIKMHLVEARMNKQWETLADAMLATAQQVSCAGQRRQLGYADLGANVDGFTGRVFSAVDGFPDIASFPGAPEEAGCCVSSPGVCEASRVNANKSKQPKKKDEDTLKVEAIMEARQMARRKRWNLEAQRRRIASQAKTAATAKAAAAKKKAARKARAAASAACKSRKGSSRGMGDLAVP